MAPSGALTHPGPRGADSTPAVRLVEVDKRFGETHAVRDLSLEIPRGRLTGFLGPNGAGKSTTLRMIMSILAPDRGRIEVLGGDARDHKDRLGYLPETRGLYPKMKVGELLRYLAHLKGDERPDLGARIRAGLRRFDLGHLEQERCRALSKGMQQKVQILASMLHEPELLILDEPFSGLDPVATEQMQAMVRGLADHGVTLLYSTHALHQAEQLCDHIVLIDRGHKVLDTSMEDLRGRLDRRTLEVELIEGDLAADLPGVLRVEPGAPRHFALSLDEGADPRRVMSEVTARHAVRALALRRPSLQEVFVRLVAGDGRRPD